MHPNMLIIVLGGVGVLLWLADTLAKRFGAGKTELWDNIVAYLRGSEGAVRSLDALDREVETVAQKRERRRENIRRLKRLLAKLEAEEAADPIEEGGV